MIWHEVHIAVGDIQPLSCLAPIWGHTGFKSGTNDLGFKQWSHKGIRRIIDLYNGDTLMSFNKIKDKFNIPQSHFFKYLQLRSFIHSKLNHSSNCPPLTMLERFATQHQRSKGQISILYNIFSYHSKESSDSIRRSWGEDLQECVLDGEWNQICSKAQSLLINSRLKLIQYNWIMRTYITPVKLNKFNPDIPDTCVKCQTHKGTLFPCIWECEKMQKFWKEIIHIISQIISIPIPISPKFCILGLYPQNLSLKSHEIKLINLCLIHSKRLIAMYWRNITCPPISHWLKDLSSCLALEKLTYILKHKLGEFYEIWGLVLNFLENTDLQHTLDSVTTS